MFNSHGKGRPKPLGVEVTLTPVKSVNGLEWEASATYKGRTLKATSYSKQNAIRYIREDIEKEIIFQESKTEVVVI